MLNQSSLTDSKCNELVSPSLYSLKSQFKTDIEDIRKQLWTKGSNFIQQLKQIEPYYWVKNEHINEYFKVYYPVEFCFFQFETEPINEGSFNISIGMMHRREPYTAELKQHFLGIFQGRNIKFCTLL